MMTPCTRVMMMDRWVKEYIKDWRDEKLEQYEAACFNSEFINTTELNINTKIKEYLQKISKMFSFYKVRVLTTLDDIEKLTLKIIYGMLKKDERKFKMEFISRILANQNFIKSALVVSVEIVLFIENVEEISFYKLADTLELDLYEFWKIINPFLNFDLCLPSDIRLHFNEIELQLFSFMIWRKASLNFKEEINDFLKDYELLLFDKDVKEVEDIEFNNQSLFVYQDKNIFSMENFIDLISPSTTTENSSTSVEKYTNHGNLKSYKFIKPVYIFLRRLLNYSIFLNKKISENLKLSNETAKECEKLFKNIITGRKSIEIFYNKHVDQIIICTIISVMKFRNMYEEKGGVKILLEAYRKTKPDDSEGVVKSLFYNIKLTSSKDKNIDIMDFYQEFFVEKLEIEKLLTKFITNEDEEQFFRDRAKRRKFSVPTEAEISKFQFEDETAFENNTIMYEPLTKTIFNKNDNTGILSNRTLGFHAGGLGSRVYLSASSRCSPMVGRSPYNYLSPSPGVNRTPRTMRVMDSYTDYPYTSGEALTFSNSSILSSGNGNSNHYKNKLKSFLSGGKMHKNSGSNIIIYLFFIRFRR
jgi:hypothetical protein